MPVTAKLSREFYEKFGGWVADDLVNWFNEVDATYRSDFRDLFEVHFARFDAKLEQRVAELRAEFDVKIERLSANLEQRLGEQTRWLLGAWAIVLASVIGLWFGR